MIEIPPRWHLIRRRVCGDDVRRDGKAWLACFVRHIPRTRLPPENVEGAEDPNLATSSLPHLASRTSNRCAGFKHAPTRSLSFPSLLFPTPQPPTGSGSRASASRVRIARDRPPRVIDPSCLAQTTAAFLSGPALSAASHTAEWPLRTTDDYPLLSFPHRASSRAPVPLPRGTPTGRSADPCGPQRAGVHVLAQGQGLFAFVAAA